MQKNQSSSISNVQVNVDESRKCSTIDQACLGNDSVFPSTNSHRQETATDLDANMQAQSEDTDSSSPGSMSTQLRRPIRRKRRLRDKMPICGVCGDKAISYNFGAIVCATCKAFFRRNAQKQKKLQPCAFNNNCTITKITRRFCPICRLNKCFSIGMDPLFLLDDDEKSIRQARREHKKHLKGQQSQVASDDKPVGGEKPTTASSEHFNKNNTGRVLEPSTPASQPSSYSSCITALITQAITSSTAENNKQFKKTPYGDSGHTGDVKYDFQNSASGPCISRVEHQVGFSFPDSSSSSCGTKMPCVSSSVDLINRESLMNVQETQSAAQSMTYQSQKTTVDVDFLTEAVDINCDSDEGFAQPVESTISQRNQTCAKNSSHLSAGDTCTQSSFHEKSAFSPHFANKAAVSNQFMTVDEATFVSSALSDHCHFPPPSDISNSDLFDTETFPDFLMSMMCPPTPSHSIIGHEQPDSVTSPGDSEPNINHGVLTAEGRSGCMCFSQESPSRLCDPKDWSHFTGLEKYCRGKNFTCESQNGLPQDASLYWSLDEEERDTLTKLTTAYQEIPLKTHLDESARKGEVTPVLDFSFRNSVSFAKIVPGFRQLRKEDQIATIKASVVQTHFIRGASIYDPHKRQWSFKSKSYSVEDRARYWMQLYKGSNTCFAKMTSYSEALQCVVEKDDTLFALLHCIVLFDPRYPQVEDRNLLNRLRDSYILLLKHYLESKFSFLHADTYMIELMANLKDLRELGERFTAHYKHLALNKQPLVAEILTD